MAGPKLAQGHRGRVYTWPPDTDAPDVILPAWSTISRHITCLQGPALWAAGDFVRDNIDRLMTYSPEDIRRRVATSPDLVWHPKRDRGSAAHSLIAQWLTGEPLDDSRGIAQYYEAAAPYLEAAQAFHSEWVAEDLYVETTIFNETEKYAGTFDLLAELRDGSTVIVDWKTGGVYPEHALQMCAYANGEWIGTPDGTRHEMPAVHRGIIVQLKEDASYVVWPVNLSGALWDAVKGMRAYAGWHAYARNHAYGTKWASRWEDDGKLRPSDRPAAPSRIH